MDFENALAAYEQAPDELDMAVAGLSDAELDTARSAGEWTTRQIVHHLADGEAHWLTPIKMALIEPGFVYYHNNWNQEASSGALAYATRQVAQSLALFRAQRTHILQLLQELPGAWDRYVEFTWLEPDNESKRRRVTVADIINMQIRHAAGHIAEI
ncbi:MAG: DinB family protein, partial [Chloroflexota bacterium]